MAQLTEDEKKQLFEKLQEINDQQNRIVQALFGDEKIGLSGLVKDVSSLKHWRNEMAMKTSSIAGAIAVVVTLLTLFGKYIAEKITGKG